MKIKIISLTILVTISYLSFGQKTVVITKYAHSVPKGKKWILPKNKETLIEVSSGVLTTGSLCNARLYSPSRGSISGVVSGEYGRPDKVYAILFSSLSKEPHANQYTFRVTTESFVSVSPSSRQEVNEQQIVFLEGEKVFTGECLTSIQLFESALTQNELQVVNQKKKEQEEKVISSQYKPVGDRLLNVTSSSLNGIDDWSDHGITGLNKILIRDKKNKFILINDKGVITKYDVRSIKNLENGDQEFEIGRFDRATLTIKEDNVNVNLQTIHHQDMGHTSVWINATMDLISTEQADSLILKTENAKHIADSIKENTYPKYVSSQIISRSFTIIKKGGNNDELQIQTKTKEATTNGMNSLGKLLTKPESVNINDIIGSPTLISRIKSEMQDKKNGTYFMSFVISERVLEIKKAVYEKDYGKIGLVTFYKGTFQNPKETYVNNDAKKVIRELENSAHNLNAYK